MKTKKAHVFSAILDGNEKLLWIDKPNFILYVVIKNLPINIFILLFLGFVHFFFSMIFAGGDGDNNIVYTMYALFIIPIILLFIKTTIGSLLSYFNTYYACTNKRLIVRTGAVGISFEFLDYDQIENITLRTGVIEKKFNCGSLFISNQSEEDTSDNEPSGLIFQNIKKPEATYKAIQRIIRDIRTDWVYPNKLRTQKSQNHANTDTINPAYSANLLNVKSTCQKEIEALQFSSEDNEKFIWTDKPHKIYFLLSVLFLFAFITAFLFFTNFFSSLTFSVIIGSVASIVYFHISYPKTHYGITNKKIISQTWLLGEQSTSVDLDKIHESKVIISPIGKWLGNFGHIVIYTQQGRATTFFCIEDPYDVNTLITQLTLEMKKDIAYPNAQRPNNNNTPYSNYENNSN